MLQGFSNPALALKFRVFTFSNTNDAIVRVTVRLLKLSLKVDDEIGSKWRGGDFGDYQELLRPHKAFYANWVNLRSRQKEN